MKRIRIYYRGTGEDWPDERPDQFDEVPDNEVEATKAELATYGFKVTGTREINWREQLARMENPEL